MVITGCTEAGMLWNRLPWDFNELHYNNESSKPVCAVLLGVRADSWSWGLDVCLLKSL